MKKIGIITWHYLENYGSVLQAYALQKYIRNLNEDVEIINYRPNAKTGHVYDALRNFVYLLHYPKNTFRRRKKAFHQFRLQYMKESPMYDSYEELLKKANKYDVYICGSDQIWAPNRIKKAYLLDFVSDDKIKIAYAPSIVIDNFTPAQQKHIKKSISKFHHLSLREPYGVKIIERITGIKAIDVLDPTLLLSREDYEQLIIEPKLDKPYILCYLIGDKMEHRELIKEIKELYGYDIVTLPFKDFDLEFGDIQIRDAGPSEFLGLVKNASIICTDSFHGILFSIIFEKSFYAFKRFDENDVFNQNARVINIIDKLGLEDRIINELKDVDVKKEINYKKVMSKLAKEKTKSIAYLKDALK